MLARIALFRVDIRAKWDCLLQSNNQHSIYDEYVRTCTYVGMGIQLFFSRNLPCFWLILHYQLGRFVTLLPTYRPQSVEHARVKC